MEKQPSVERRLIPPDAEAQLLLSTAKPNFDRNQLGKIKFLTRQVADWSFVTETAQRKFSATYLYKALAECSSDSVPSSAMKRLASAAEFTRLRTLKIAAALIQFHQSCIVPINAKHAYVKGIALSLQCNGDFADRYCRDIDVLIAEDQFEEVIQNAIGSGYKALMETEPITFANTRDDIKFLTRFRGDIGLISPDGTLIEVHRRLDKRNSVFDVNDALRSIEPVTFSNVTINTLRPALHFTYACYHHSRHYWSHLHWLADLDLMLNSSKFDRSEIDSVADALGLSPTIDASVDLLRAVSRPDQWNELRASSDLAGKFLHSCLLNLNGDLSLEYELIKGSFTRDFISEDQLSAQQSKRISTSSWKKSLDPSLTQYLKRPLPAAFFWMYRIERAIIVLRDNLAHFDLFRRSKKVDTPSHADE